MQDNAEYVDSTHFYDGVTEYLDRTSQRSFRGYRRGFFFHIFKIKGKILASTKVNVNFTNGSKISFKMEKAENFSVCSPCLSFLHWPKFFWIKS